MTAVVVATFVFRMPPEHLVVPSLRLAEVAVVLAGALGGKQVPSAVPARDVIAVLERGVAAWGGPDGVRRVTEQNRLMSLQERTTALSFEQRRERRAIWSGGRRREQSLVDLAFRIMNNPHDGYEPEPVKPEDLEPWDLVWDSAGDAG